jgi:hypothetical protein
VCSRSKRRRNICHNRSTPAAVAAVAENHSHNGFGVPSPGNRSTCSRITVPSMIGRSPAWPAQVPRRVSVGCSRSHDWARAVPYLVVWVVVWCAASGQVWESANVNSAP